jgi:hypothetical protein
MGKPMAAATCCMPVRKRGCGNAARRNVSSLSATALPPTSMAARVIVKPEPSWMMRAVSVNSWPGNTKVRNFASLTDARKGIRSNFVSPMMSQPEVCAIDSTRSTPGIKG